MVKPFQISALYTMLRFKIVTVSELTVFFIMIVYWFSLLSKLGYSTRFLFLNWSPAGGSSFQQWMYLGLSSFFGVLDWLLSPFYFSRITSLASDFFGCIVHNLVQSENWIWKKKKVLNMVFLVMLLVLFLMVFPMSLFLLDSPLCGFSFLSRGFDWVLLFLFHSVFGLVLLFLPQSPPAFRFLVSWNTKRCNFLDPSTVLLLLLTPIRNYSQYTCLAYWQIS